ncbi:MAG: pyruvate formate lyase family protein [Candidatus Sumerlaeota bacterium]
MIDAMRTCDRLQVLGELKEWAAYGFYESLQANDPWPIPYGKALRVLYERMEIRLPDDHYLVPCEPVPGAHRRDASDGIGQMGLLGAGMILAPESIHGLKVADWATEKKAKEFPEYANAIGEITADLHEHFSKHASRMTHSSPDIERALREGLVGMEAEIAGEKSRLLKSADDPDALHLMEAVEEMIVGLKVFHKRMLAALNERCKKAQGQERNRWMTIRDAWKQSLLKPAGHFVEGLLAVNWLFMLDGCDSIGRLDYLLGDLFDMDLANGTLDIEFARILLDNFWAYFQDFGGWNIQIGGADGNGVCDNALTHEILATCRRNLTAKPSVSLRINSRTPDATLHEALRTISLGAGQPALYNDDRYVALLPEMIPHMRPEDAQQLGFAGCTETLINGMTNQGSVAGRPDMTLVRALIWTLYDGVNPFNDKVEGLRTGAFESFETFDDFLLALEQQIIFMVAHYASQYKSLFDESMDKGDPGIFRTLFTRDCIKNHKGFAFGGARYNWHYVNCLGTTTMIDSVAAIRHCVFENHSVSRAELIDALRKNYNGYEAVRQKLKAAPKFGNDIDEVDQIGRRIIETAWKEFCSTPGPLGPFVPSIIPWGLYVFAGKRIVATPDGRRDGEPLNDSVGASAGADRRGPTALLRSVTRLPLDLAVSTPVLNLRFQKSFMQSQEDIANLAALIRAFFAEGGMQVQISVLNAEDMRAAQKTPEKYQNLLVRIGGYSEYFVGLDKQFQDSIIERTEHQI